MEVAIISEMPDRDAHRDTCLSQTMRPLFFHPEMKILLDLNTNNCTWTGARRDLREEKDLTPASGMLTHNNYGAFINSGAAFDLWGCSKMKVTKVVFMVACTLPLPRGRSVAGGQTLIALICRLTQFSTVGSLLFLRKSLRQPLWSTCKQMILLLKP